MQEKGHDGVTLKGMGRAINKTVTIAEIIKRRIPKLHQLTEIGSVNITDTWEPLEEGLNTLETIRHVSVISIVLSTSELDTSKPGYQLPLPEDQVKPLQEGPPRRVRPPQPGPAARGRYTSISTYIDAGMSHSSCAQRTCTEHVVCKVTQRGGRLTIVYVHAGRCMGYLVKADASACALTVHAPAS